MATQTRPERKKIPRGRAQFEIQGDGKTLAVHVDRKGFRRLVETLERLAETGRQQRFERSGRARPGAGDRSGDDGKAVTGLVFHIEDDG